MDSRTSLQLPQQLSEIRRLIDTGRFDPALSKCTDLLQLYPNNADINLMAGEIYFITQHLDQAERLLLQAIHQQPGLVDAHHLLGVVLDHSGQKERAIHAMQEAQKLAPNNAGICANLGALLIDTGKFNAAEPLLIRAKKLGDKRAVSYNNTGNLYRKKLEYKKSIKEYQQAVSLEPDNIRYRTNLIRAMTCYPEQDIRENYAFIESTGRVIQSIFPRLFTHYDITGEKIKIGYLGSTLRQHSVAYYLLPILENHSNKFETFCYHIGELEDDMTGFIRNFCDHYQNLHGERSESVAKQIHDDGINILIELDGYTEPDGLMVLGHKPAPLQIEWIGWPDTTGMSRIDYRIVDDFTDPAQSIADNIHTEKLIRMPQSFSVYTPPLKSPDVRETPAKGNGYITFGSFNIPFKMNHAVIGVWANLLSTVPRSVLLLKHSVISEESMQQNIIAAFATHGIAEDRLQFLGFELSTDSHLARYHEVDIALDPFPYAGTTTTCDSMWMGVPVITLAGEKHVSRVGVSQLRNVGHPELIARDHDEYIRIARDLASDIERLNLLRMSLREKMLNSPLMAARDFTIKLESELDRIWREYKATADL